MTGVLSSLVPFWAGLQIHCNPDKDEAKFSDVLRKFLPKFS